MDEKKPYWYPVRTDSEWVARIRKEYGSEIEEGTTDEEIVVIYADGAKYQTLWDNLGDAYEDYERLADAYLALVEQGEA